MRCFSTILAATLLLSSTAAAQVTYPYIVRNFAGTFPLGDGGLATSALLYYPNAAVPDASGNLYILDAANYRIRKVTPDGRIATFAKLFLYGYDMKRGSDGALYVGGVAGVAKVSPSGEVSVLAGTGTYGFGGDGGAATAAQVGDAFGVAVDTAGNVYFSDVSKSSNRIRQVTPDGKIRTVAGGAAADFTGDNGPAANATFDTPSGVAVDSAGNIYVADYYNLRVRKFTVGGNITTFAGNGRLGRPTGGPATGNTLGTPDGVFVDSRDNVYFTDTLTSSVVRVSPTGALTVIAGNVDPYIPIEDGPALSCALREPANAGVDENGNVYIVEQTHRVRKVGSDGRLVTIAGRLHYAGDNGPAASAILNEPTDIAFDAAGNAYIADGGNYLIRMVSPAGVISTFAGKLNPGVPVNGSSIGNAQLPYIRFVAFDSKGAMFLAGNSIIYKVANGILNIYAGTGASGNAGDGGRATSATFSGIAGIALNASGDLFVADSNRIRVISADTGVINAFAGSGVRGRAGDGSLATGALFDFSSRAYMAFDRSGNLYVSDANNFSVRMIDARNIITTVVGNGSYGHSDGAAATAAFSVPGALAFDAAGNLYVASQSYGEIYRLSGGILRRIAGAGNNPPDDGLPALTSILPTYGMKIDANNDIYSVDIATSAVRKLILNSPTTFVVSDGNGQTAQTGQALPKLLKVQLTGRAATGVAGVPISFAVKSGAARLSATTAQTDASGFAAVSLTLGDTAGPVVITATAADTSLAPLQFTATATAPPSSCSVPQPAIVSVRSAGDFGGSASFASGSWLEIKGANLAQNTRQWTGDDFSGANAPTSLDGVSVSINGRRAFVGYISPTQINVQAPADSATGSLNLTVTTAGCASTAFLVQKTAMAGGLLAPSAFNIGGRQYIAALFQDNLTFVGKANLIAGVPFRPATPGDTITLYGIGFGDVVPAIAPGTIVSAANQLPDVAISFGSTPATVSYAGLAPNAVGLYQFNVVVPNVDGDQPIGVKVGGVDIQQVAWLTVQK